MWKDIKAFLSAFAVAAPIAFTLVEKVGYFTKVTGKSMQPVLNPESSKEQNDYVFVNKLACRNYEFKRGEIVSLHLYARMEKNPARQKT